MSNKLSVVINAQNVANDLANAIASVKQIADELIVINQSSTDSTAEIAKKLGAKVFNFKSVPYVELARNYAISKATNEWVFILDPDEEIPQKLANKIKEIITDPAADYFYIPRKNIIFAKWIKHSRWWPDLNIRLFKKGFVSWTEVVHAVPITHGVGAEIGTDENLAIIHHHYTSIEQFIERSNRYTTASANKLINDGYKFSWKDLLGKPIDEFFSRYFSGQGYKDGLHGLVLALLQSFSELIMYLKVWQTEKFIEPDINLKDVNILIHKKEKEMRYWQNDTIYKETGNISARIKRKLRI